MWRTPRSGHPAAKFTVEFDKTPFKDVVKWLSSEAHLNVVVDGSALDLNPLLSTEPVTDRLRDEPLLENYRTAQKTSKPRPQINPRPPG